MMLGMSPLPNVPSEPYVPSFLKTGYPNAIDGDAVVFFGDTDAPELWVKYGSTWKQGWVPGGGPGATMEYRPDYKRIIDDRTKLGDPRLRNFDPITGLPVVDFPTGGISAGNLALIGLLGFLLLRGAIK